MDPIHTLKCFMFTAILRITQYETTCMNDSTTILSLGGLWSRHHSGRTLSFDWPLFWALRRTMYFNPFSLGHPLLVNVSIVDLFLSFTPVYITGHPSCLDMNIQLVAVIQTYPWQCMECKTCIICRDPFDEVMNPHGPLLKIPYLYV